MVLAGDGGRRAKDAAPSRERLTGCRVSTTNLCTRVPDTSSGSYRRKKIQLVRKHRDWVHLDCREGGGGLSGPLYSEALDLRVREELGDGTAEPRGPRPRS